jgi:hypothetical protein
MADADRRSFLRSTGAALAAAALGGAAAGCAPGDDATSETTRGTLPGDLLRALASVVLPASALGSEGVEEAVVAFEAWTAGFEPVAELEHGYGTSEIRYGPPDPAPGWASQLEGLEIESRRRFEVSFTALTPEDRRGLVVGHLSGVEGIPAATRAPHVALGLLAHFYGTPRATDLCYGRLIRKETCRGLAGVEALPPLLESVTASRLPSAVPASATGSRVAARPTLQVAAGLDRDADPTRGS